jgi:tRNA(Ile)-lysidine synthase
VSGRTPPERLADGLRARLATGPADPGHPLVVAVSGGLDSVALLHLLRFPLKDLGFPLFAAHLDHAMRPGSAADAAWVRGLCRAWNVPLESGRLDPPARSEADARVRRYAFLEEHTPPGGWILTAHHRDDQAETVLFRAVRGTGLRGLRGIAPRRGRVLRPLLDLGRHELLAYARSVGLRWRDDPSNRDLRYARNRIRHVVLPELERARPGAARALARLASRARAAETAWDQALHRLLDDVLVEADEAGASLARGVLLSYHPHLRSRVLRNVLRRYGSTPDRAGTRAALEFISSGSSGGEVHLAGGTRIERDFDRIRVIRETVRRDDTTVTIPGPGPGRAGAVIGGHAIEVAWGPSGGTRIGSRIRLAEPAFPVVVRGWRPGDRIRFAYGHKKLKKLFVERRLDRRERRRVPVVADAAGRVLWIVGVARAEGVSDEGEGLEIAVRDAGQP